MHWTVFDGCDAQHSTAQHSTIFRSIEANCQLQVTHSFHFMILHRNVPFWVVRFASMCYFRWPSNVVHYAHVWIWLFSRSLLVFCCSVSVYFSAIRIKMISTLVFCSWINEKQKLHEKKLKTNDQPFDAISQMDYGFIMSNAKYRRFGHFVLYYLFNRNSLWFLFFFVMFKPFKHTNVKYSE